MTSVASVLPAHAHKCSDGTAKAQSSTGGFPLSQDRIAHPSRALSGERGDDVRPVCEVLMNRRQAATSAFGSVSQLDSQEAEASEELLGTFQEPRTRDRRAVADSRRTAISASDSDLQLIGRTSVTTFRRVVERAPAGPHAIQPSWCNQGIRSVPDHCSSISKRAPTGLDLINSQISL